MVAAAAPRTAAESAKVQDPARILGTGPRLLRRASSRSLAAKDAGGGARKEGEAARRSEGKGGQRDLEAEKDARYRRQVKRRRPGRIM